MIEFFQSGTLHRRRWGNGRFSGALLLACCTLLVYWGVLSSDFVNYDDYKYVLENPVVRAGLTLKGFQWAWSNLEAGFWHPLTWLSHMLDCEIYGINPMGHHLSSLLLHLANSVLLFLVLSRITGCTGRSWFVAALFALHPLHVESAAWVSERKDVLSTLFLILSIWAYASYATRRGVRRYALSLVLFLLGLMAKSMLVTLPFVLLLFDYWPLDRLSLRTRTEKNLPPTKEPSSLGLLLLEKLPFFGFSLLFTFVTWHAESGLNALSSLDSISLGMRAEGVLVGYGSYLVKTIRPENLSVIYLRQAWPLWQIMVSAMLLAAISAISVRSYRKRPYVPVGWLWYIITLAPVSGIVPIGSHVMADRYTYVPLIGIFIIVAWGIPEFFAPRQRTLLHLLAGAVLLVFSICTWSQIKHWQNSLTLFEQATGVDKKNYLAQYNLGFVLSQRGRFDQAVIHFEEALRANPGYADTHFALAVALEKLEKTEEAVAHYQRVLDINPRASRPHVLIGEIFLRQGDVANAISHFEKALGIDPEDKKAQADLKEARKMQRSEVRDQRSGK